MNLAQVVKLVNTRDLKSLALMWLASSILALGTTFVRAEQEPSRWWYTAPVSSWHKGSHPYNERNLGFGLQYELTDTFSIFAVRYPNSFDQWTTGIGFPYFPQWSRLEVQRLSLRPGIAPTFFRGYSGKKWELVPLPTIDVLWDKKWGINIVTDFDTFAGFSMKFNIGVLE